MGDRDSTVGDFVARNLDAAGIKGRFALSTDEFAFHTAHADPSRLVLIEPDWDLLLTLELPQARLFVVKGRGATWDPPRQSAEFEIQDPYGDGRLFQRHILSWFAED